jgi:hypothetical protein
MRIIFDQGTPAPLRHALADHDVTTAQEKGWSELSNGDFLRAAQAGFDALVTTDHNLRYQQNTAGCRLAILVLSTTSWPRIQRHLERVVSAVNGLKPSDFVEVEIPLE